MPEIATEASPDPIARYRSRGGKLSQVTGNYPFVLWRPGDEWVTLDGDFTPAELRAFADHMDAAQKPIAGEEPEPRETKRGKKKAA